LIIEVNSFLANSKRAFLSASILSISDVSVEYINSANHLVIVPLVVYIPLNLLIAIVTASNTITNTPIAATIQPKTTNNGFTTAINIFPNALKNGFNAVKNTLILLKNPTKPCFSLVHNETNNAVNEAPIVVASAPVLDNLAA
jgi:hypothetical protein